MERKIGEIFEYNGEWYQCVQNKECNGCAFHGDEDKCCMEECTIINRSDSTSVIFKKLKKVGEPFKRNGYMYQEYKAHTYPLLISVGAKIPTANGFAVIIKQTKEDMEDLDKIKVRDYTKVEELNVMEEKKLSLKPFDLQKAKEGKPVCTRDGRKARIVCVDRVDAKPILALITSTDRKGEDVFDYFVSGKRMANALESDLDLMMLPEKKEGWVNVYNADTTFYYVEGMVYNTKDEAIQKAKEEITTEQREKSEYVDTVKISWEE